jgi:MFS family permease
MRSIVLPLAITFAVQAAVAVALYSSPVIAPAAAGGLGVAPAAIGYFISIAYVGSMVGSVCAGAVVSRLGPIRVSQIGLASCFLGMTLAAAAPGLPVREATLALLMLAALCVGLGYGPAVPASSAMLARTAPPGLVTLIFSIKQTGVPAGAALAGVMAPAIILLAGWRWTAFAIGLGCALLAAALEGTRALYDVRLNAAAQLSLRRMVAPLGLVVRDRRLLELAATAILFGGVQMTLVAYLVTFVIDIFSASLVVAGLVLSVSQVASVIGRLGWAILADRFRNRRAVLGLLGIAMGVLACATLAASPHWPRWLLFAFAAAFGATAVGWNGVYLAEVAHVAPIEKTSEATGGGLFVTFFGAVASPLVFHFLLSLTGTYSVPYAFAGVLALLAGGRLLLVRKPA